jgi:anti-sigma B factor antagonist
MAFTQQVRADASGLVVILSGEMDFSVSGPFEDTVQRLIAEKRPGLLQVDLAGLVFLDSTAVSVIVRLWRLARREHCSLRVVNPTGVVRQVLDVTGALAIVGVNSNSAPGTTVQ